MKKICMVLTALVCAVSAVSAGGKKDSGTREAFQNSRIIASTPWTAAFADLAGLDDVGSLAPADMKHPPEYELTVSDIQKVTGSRYLIYAGYERMMKTICEAAGTIQLIKIQTDNSTATVESQAKLIASYTHTEAESEKRVASYKKAVADGKALAAAQGITGKKVLVHAMQVYLAKDLGITVTDTFGPGPVTAAQLAKAKEAGYDIIIDNVHNPVASPFAEVCPGAKIVVWRNFPAETGRGALERVVQENISALLK